MSQVMEIFFSCGNGRRARMVPAAPVGAKRINNLFYSSVNEAAPGAHCAVAVAAPTVTTLPSIAGSGKVGTPLVATSGTYTGNPTLSGQWYSGTSKISGATGKSYTPVAGDVGATLAYEETATNAGGNVKGRSTDKTITA